MYFCLICFIISRESAGMWVRGHQKAHKQTAQCLLCRNPCIDDADASFFVQNPDRIHYWSGCRRLYNRGQPQRPTGSFLLMIFEHPDRHNSVAVLSFWGKNEKNIYIAIICVVVRTVVRRHHVHVGLWLKCVFIMSKRLRF